MMSTVSADNFIKNTSSYLKRAVKPKSEILIKAEEGELILVNASEYRSIKETAYLKGIPGMWESIETGLLAPKEELLEVDWKNEL